MGAATRGSRSEAVGVSATARPHEFCHLTGAQCRATRRGMHSHCSKRRLSSAWPFVADSETVAVQTRVVWREHGDDVRSGPWRLGWRLAVARMARFLCDAGHEVLTPTLSGLGERAAQAGDEVSLLTHSADLMAHLWFEDLIEVVLVGCSYGILPVEGDRMPERMHLVVNLDGPVAEEGAPLGLDGWEADVARLTHGPRVTGPSAKVLPRPFRRATHGSVGRPRWADGSAEFAGGVVLGTMTTAAARTITATAAARYSRGRR